MKDSDRVPSFGVEASDPQPLRQMLREVPAAQVSAPPALFQIYPNSRPVGAAVLLIIALFKLP